MRYLTPGIAAVLAALAAALPAFAADITATPPAGGGFVVTNADQSAERLRVNEDGSVTIPALASSPGGDGWVCFNSATGRLGKCPAPTVNLASKIYVKTVEFPVGTSSPVQSFVAECDSMADKVIGGLANISFSTNRIASTNYADYFFRVVLTVTDMDTLTVNFTCMRTT